MNCTKCEKPLKPNGNSEVCPECQAKAMDYWDYVDSEIDKYKINPAGYRKPARGTDEPDPFKR